MCLNLNSLVHNVIVSSSKCMSPLHGIHGPGMLCIVFLRIVSM